MPLISSTEAAAACEAGLQAVIVDRSIEQEGGIELEEEVRKNFPVIDNLNELFGEEDEDDEEFAQVAYWILLLSRNEQAHEFMALFFLCKLIFQTCMCSHPVGLDIWFLAHLSRRLTRWAYSIPMVRCLSVVIIHTFKLEYLWSQLANLDQILCVASLGWGKACIRFWGRLDLDPNSGFHGNRKPPLTYNWENYVSTFSRLFFIRSFLFLQVTRTCIKSWMSLNFGQIRPLATELAALERLKNSP